MNLNYIKLMREIKEQNDLKNIHTKTKDFSNSSTIKKMSYNEETKVLTVTFTNDKRYEYYNVPSEVWDLTANVDSIGRFMGSNIKGFYEYKAI